MHKFLTRTFAIAAMAVGVAMGGAAVASAAPAIDSGPFEPYPSVISEQQTWNEGGALAGEGAAMLVSAAWVGVPAQAMDYAEEAFPGFGRG